MRNSKFHPFLYEFIVSDGQLSALKSNEVIIDHGVLRVPVLARLCLGRLYAVLLRPVFFCLKEVQPGQKE